jgi:hypothetical protein
LCAVFGEGLEKGLQRIHISQYGIALVLNYRDRAGHAATAAALGCSVRTLAYMLPAARRRLADVLDRRDLL